MLKLKISKVRVKVRITFWGGGSVLAETVSTKCSEVKTHLEIESDEDPKKIAKLARVAEAGCYVIQTIRHPSPVNYEVTLNGQPLQLHSDSQT